MNSIEPNRERDLNILNSFKKYIQKYKCMGNPEKHEFKINGLLTYYPDCENNYVVKYTDINQGWNTRKDLYSFDIFKTIDFSTEEGYFQSTLIYEAEEIIMLMLFQYLVTNVDRIIVIDMDDFFGFYRTFYSKE